MSDYEQNYLELQKCYGSLIFSFVDRILSSSELLDDDFEAILSVYRLGQFEFEASKRKTGFLPILGTASSLLATMVTAKHLRTLGVVFSAILTTGFACYTFYQQKKIYKTETVIPELIQKLKSLQSLNRKIYTYLRDRKKHSEECYLRLFKPYSETLNEFMQILSKQQFNLQFEMIKNICSLSKFYSPLQKDCNLLKQLKRSYAGNIFEKGLDNSLKYMKTGIDMQQYLNSKFLSYFCLICCAEGTNMTAQILDRVLNDEIPELIKMVTLHHKIISELFDSLGYKVLKSSYPDSSKWALKPIRFEELMIALQNSENRVCFSLDKHYKLIDIIERSHHNPDNEKIVNTLKLLRDDTTDAVEAISTVCRVYESVMTFRKKKLRDRRTAVKKYMCADNQATDEMKASQSADVEAIQVAYEDLFSDHMKRIQKQLKDNFKPNERDTAAHMRWIEGNAEFSCSVSPEDSSSGDNSDHEMIATKSNTTTATAETKEQLNLAVVNPISEVSTASTKINQDVHSSSLSKSDNSEEQKEETPREIELSFKLKVADDLQPEEVSLSNVGLVDEEIVQNSYGMVNHPSDKQCWKEGSDENSSDGFPKHQDTSGASKSDIITATAENKEQLNVSVVNLSSEVPTASPKRNQDVRSPSLSESDNSEINTLTGIVETEDQEKEIPRKIETIFLNEDKLDLSFKSKEADDLQQEESSVSNVRQVVEEIIQNFNRELSYPSDKQCWKKGSDGNSPQHQSISGTSKSDIITATAETKEQVNLPVVNPSSEVSTILTHNDEKQVGGSSLTDCDSSDIDILTRTRDTEEQQE